MAFGMCNAPATFQRLMRRVLSGVAYCEAYLDDVVIYSADWQSHVEALSTVFQCLQEASLTLNLVKCEFAKAIITYLGKQVGQGQVHPIDAKVTAIAKFPVPTTKRELCRFLA
uniref:ribonuclease H n=1 Tax=Anguilla anguilla TaxID=7936 RepID=A0A0E9R573_ANGAN